VKALTVLLLGMLMATTPQLTGTLSIKGNSPFTWVCLTDAQGRAWRVEGEEALLETLRTLQNRTVTLQVEETPQAPTKPGPQPPTVTVTGVVKVQK